MDYHICSQRIGQVIRVDSIAVDDSDFIATHIPFRKIVYRTSLQGSDYQSISEESIFQKIFLDDGCDDKHQFIVVDGSSGSGKSHFIRWIDTQLRIHGLNNNDEILLIRRSDNTLKGTIKQLLELDSIKFLKDNEKYKRLVKANQTISESKFKGEILYKFVNEIESPSSNDDDMILSSIKKKRLAALLKNEMFATRMKSANGPIDRIYSKIVHSNNTEDSTALFFKDDFIIEEDDPSFDFEQFLNTADKNAIGIAKKMYNDNDSIDLELINDVVSYLNSIVDRVIQSCAGIEEGDFEQIFKEIRQSLFKQHKNLILLIEDITSFTGVNKELLNVLVTEHQGANSKDQMCRLISLIGTTTQYYDTFRSNYLDRITTQITIQDGAIGANIEDLYLFFAKYLNAVSIDKIEFENWLKNGALDNSLPIYSDNTNWEYIKYYDKQMSLFPFTKQSIKNFYSVMDEHRTPRYILKEIIGPAITQLCIDEKQFMKFITFSKNPISENIRSRIMNTVSQLNLDSIDPNNYAADAIKFIGFWGNNTLGKKKENLIGISKNIYNRFGFSELYNYLISRVDDDLNSNGDTNSDGENIIEKPAQKDITNQEYESYKKIISDWFYSGTVIQKPRYLLDAVKTLVLDSINWQQYGISSDELDYLKLGSVVPFSFEGQGQGKDGVFELPKTQSTYDLFIAAIQWDFLGKKSFNFNNASEAIFNLTKWINLNVDKLISTLKSKFNKNQEYIQVALLCEIYRKILLGDFGINNISQLKPDYLLDKYDSVQKIEHTDEWNNLANLISQDDNNSGKKIYDIIVNHFNITQGTGGIVKFINYGDFKNSFDCLKSNKFDFSDIKLDTINNKIEKDIFTYYQKIKKDITSVEASELKVEKEYLDRVVSLMGIDITFGIEFSSSDIKYMLLLVNEFYTNVKNLGLPINNFSDTIDELKNNAKDIATMLNKISQFKNSDNFLNDLIYLSSINVKIVKKYVKLLDDVKSEYNKYVNIIDNKYEELVKKGKWDIDPRFDSLKNEYEEAMNGLVSLDE